MPVNMDTLHVEKIYVSNNNNWYVKLLLVQGMFSKTGHSVLLKDTCVVLKLHVYL